MPKFTDLLKPMRVPFLVLGPACVLVGYSTAVWSVGRVSLFYLALALVGAVAAHISVNAFNEYFDFKTGLDLRTRRTPFSGGSGALPEKPEMTGQALMVAVASLAVAALIGVYFLLVRGWGLLPLGLLGLAIVYAYTVWMVRNPWLCLVAPGLGFGPLMVMGTHFVLTGQYSWTAFVASLVPFFLVSDLLLLNQFPDVEADRSIGRKHFPILLGNRASAWIYGAFLLLAYLSIAIGVGLGLLPMLGLLGLIALALAIPAFLGALRFSENIQKLVPFMGLNVLLTLATPALMAVGLLIS